MQFLNSIKKKNATKKLFSFPEVTFFKLILNFFHRTDEFVDQYGILINFPVLWLLLLDV